MANQDTPPLFGDDEEDNLDNDELFTSAIDNLNDTSPKHELHLDDEKDLTGVPVEDDEKKEQNHEEKDMEKVELTNSLDVPVEDDEIKEKNNLDKIMANVELTNSIDVPVEDDEIKERNHEEKDMANVELTKSIDVPVKDHELKEQNHEEKDMKNVELINSIDVPVEDGEIKEQNHEEKDMANVELTNSIEVPVEDDELNEHNYEEKNMANVQLTNSIDVPVEDEERNDTNCFEEQKLDAVVPPNDIDDDDDEDLFQEKYKSNTNEKGLFDQNQIIEDCTAEVSLDSPEMEKSDAPKPDPEPESIFDAARLSPSLVSPVSPTMWSLPSSKSEEEIKEEEEMEDQFPFEIIVTEPEKRGDGMGAFMAYKILSKTSMPQFKSKEMAVYRRFSDFLGLHEKLVERHLGQGRIIPPPPEKSVVGMTKIKMSKDDGCTSNEFVEKRRAALERFLIRISKHSTLQKDPDFRDFLETDGNLPRSTSTSALSSAGVMRLFRNVGDQLGKISFKMDETDKWFEEKSQLIDSLDTQLKKLHLSIESLVENRKELALSTSSFSKSAALLGSAEEHTSLSRALSQLAEVEEQVSQIHLDQVDADFYVFSELIKDYINLITASKEALLERVKIFRAWKDAEVTLRKKREAKVKLELQGRSEKIPMASAEISEWEGKVDKYQEDFEAISKILRKELARFEKERIKDFKNKIINYLETLMNSQQQIIKYWETFLPEAKAIA